MAAAKKQLHLVLTADVPGLGSAGDAVTVAFGFAKNYLLDRGLAVVATKGTLIAARQQEQLRKLRKEKSRTDLDALAERLATTRLVLTAQANEKGTLYGGVGRDLILRHLHDQGIRGIDESMILLDHKIESLGSTSVPIRLEQKTTVQLAITVRASRG